MKKTLIAYLVDGNVSGQQMEIIGKQLSNFKYVKYSFSKEDWDKTDQLPQEEKDHVGVTLIRELIK